MERPGTVSAGDRESHGTTCNEWQGTDARRDGLKPILRARLHAVAKTDNETVEKSLLSSETEWAGQGSNLRPWD